MQYYWQKLLLLQKVLNSLIFVTTFIFSGSYSDSVLAQIVPDDTLGTESSVLTPNVEVKGETADRIDGGAIRDSNLFHSFSEFNVQEGQNVYFANPDNIDNIFTRVTGNNPSNILGTLGVNGSANLLLLNPKGIIFGKNSSLDIEGSFFGTTADSLLFKDGAEFSAVSPQTSLLSISVPLGLQVGSNPGNILVQSSLEVPNGQNFTLVGGDIDLKSSNVRTSLSNFIIPTEGIIAPGGRIELGGLSTAEIVNFEDGSNLIFPDEISRGNINLDNFFVDSSGGGGGAVAVYSQNLKLTNSYIATGINFSVESTGKQAGDINIDTTEATILNSSNGRVSSIVNITGNFLAFVESIDDVEVVNNTGDAGKIIINTGSLSATGVFEIASFTNGKGNAGSLEITAKEKISLVGEELGAGIASLVRELGTGNGANVLITTPVFFISNSIIVSGTAGEGNAGNIEINSDSLIMRDVGQIRADATETATGKAGNLKIVADLVQLSGSSTIISSSTLAQNSPAGELNIETEQLIITDGAQIRGITQGDGNGGKIKIEASSIEILGGTEDFPSGIFAASGAISPQNFQIIAGSGNGGKIDIRTNNLVIKDGAGISAQSLGDGDAGDIFVRVNDAFEVDDGQITSASIQSSGGNINITAGKIRLKGNSNFFTTVRQDTGGGGNITFTADSFVAFDDSDIFAASTDGAGGNITIDSPVFFVNGFDAESFNANPQSLEGNNRADINATGSVSGLIDIPAVNFLSNSLVELSDNAINTEELVANSCVRSSEKQNGTFIITGKGGLSVRPGNWTVSNYATGDVRAIPEAENSSNNWQSDDLIVEPEAIYRLSNGKLVLSRECIQTQ